MLTNNNLDNSNHLTIHSYPMEDEGESEGEFIEIKVPFDVVKGVAPHTFLTPNGDIYRTNHEHSDCYDVWKRTIYNS
jgi:hypothetical protein